MNDLSEHREERKDETKNREREADGEGENVLFYSVGWSGLLHAVPSYPLMRCDSVSQIRFVLSSGALDESNPVGLV